MDDPKQRALFDLYRACQDLREDPSAQLRIIERVEELDRIEERRRVMNILAPPPRPFIIHNDKHQLVRSNTPTDNFPFISLEKDLTSVVLTAVGAAIMGGSGVLMISGLIFAALIYGA